MAVIMRLFIALLQSIRNRSFIIFHVYQIYDIHVYANRHGYYYLGMRYQIFAELTVVVYILTSLIIFLLYIGQKTNTRKRKHSDIVLNKRAVTEQQSKRHRTTNFWYYISIVLVKDTVSAGVVCPGKNDRR